MRTPAFDRPRTLSSRPRSGWHRTLLAFLVTALVAALTLSAAPATAQAQTTLDPGQGELQAALDAIIDTGVTGVQARIITEKGEHVVATSGVADITTGTPVDPEGHYRVGSNTKTFIATVVLQLVAEGKLSLADTVEDHLPGLIQGNGNDGGTITIRHLLQHTSGIFNYTNDLFANLTPESFEELRYQSADAEELVAIALRHQPDFAPGTRWSYSNTGYVVAGMIIEAVTGNTWDHEVEQRIIKPLGLSDTSIPGDDLTLPHSHARGYERFTPDAPPIDTTEFSHSWAGAAGAVISTTDDLSRFFRALLAGDLLPPEQLAEMRSTIRPAAAAPVGSGYGMGIAKTPLSCGGEAWGHGGDTLGYHSREGFSADGQRSVALSATGSPTDEAGFVAAEQAFGGLVDDVLCAPAIQD